MPGLQVVLVDVRRHIASQADASLLIEAEMNAAMDTRVVDIGTDQREVTRVLAQRITPRLGLLPGGR